MNPLRWIARAFMSRIGWVAAGLLLVALGFDAKALDFTGKEQSCASGLVPEYTVTNNGGTSRPARPGCAIGFKAYSLDEIDAECSPLHLEASQLSNRHWEPPYAYSGSPTSNGGFASAQIRYNGSEIFDTNGTPWTVTAICVAPTCDSDDGDDLGFLSTAAYNAELTEACVNNCRATRAFVFNIGGSELGGDGTGIRWTSTGQTCSGQPNSTASGDQCITFEGNTVCGVKDQPDLVSDGKLPIEETPDEDDFTYSGADAGDLQEDGCVVLESGGAFCIVGAPNSPDNGIPGQPADPDGTVTYVDNSYGEGGTYNYYSSSTVNNSTNLGGADPDGDGSDSSGECEPGDTECEGGGRGDGRVKGPGGNTATFSEATDAFVAGVAGSGIGQLGSSVASAIPDGGTCPTATFSALSESFTIDAHCVILDEYYNVLRAIFAFMWLALGALIILRA